MMTLLMLLGVLDMPAWGNNAAFSVLRSDAEGTVLRITVPTIESKKVDLAGQTWDRLRIPDYGTTTELGAPVLPVIAGLVRIPWGMTAEMQVTGASSLRTLANHRVEPCQSDGTGKGFDLDASVYGQDLAYPGDLAELLPPSGLRDNWVVGVRIYPVQYNPRSSEIQIYDWMEVEVRYVADRQTEDSAGPQLTGRPTPHVFQELYQNHIVNHTGQEQRSFYWYALLVITPQAFKSEVMRLVNYHQLRPGREVFVSTLEEIGGTHPYTIRDHIRYCRGAYDITSVLLVGDDEQLPTFISGYTPPNDGGDHYYAALDWDSPLVYHNYRDDWYRDISMGRLSGANLDQIKILVDKILAYTQDPPSGNWTQRHLFIVDGKDSGGYPTFLQQKQMTATQIPYPKTVYWADGTDIYPPPTPPSGWDDYIKHIINVYQPGTVNYRGHGNPTNWPWSARPDWFMNQDTDDLVNGDYTPPVFSIACQTGQFFNGTTSLCEAFVRREGGGAVGAFGACMGTSRPENGILDCELYSNLYQYPYWDIGDAILDAILDCTVLYAWPTAIAYQWFGDPWMYVYTSPLAAPARESEALPRKDALGAIYPSPSNPEVWIPYRLASSVDVALEIHTADGRPVRTLSIGNRAPGEYTSRTRAAYWDGHNEKGEPVSSGTYFVTLKLDGSSVATRRILIVK